MQRCASSGSWGAHASCRGCLGEATLLPQRFLARGKISRLGREPFAAKTIVDWHPPQPAAQALLPCPHCRAPRPDRGRARLPQARYGSASPTYLRKVSAQWHVEDSSHSLLVRLKQQLGTASALIELLFATTTQRFDLPRKREGRLSVRRRNLRARVKRNASGWRRRRARRTSTRWRRLSRSGT